MTIVNGFITLLILLLLAYSLYRSIKRKSLLMLIPVCMQVFAAMISIMSFAGDVEALLEVEAVYILFGIVPPSALLIYDYRKMIGGFKAKGGFEGLVKGVPGKGLSSFPPEGINSIKKESSCLKSLKISDSCLRI